MKKLISLSLTSLFITAVTATPIISHISWGKIVVTTDTPNSTIKEEFKDCKLSPKGASNWDWAKTGTRHVPGIKAADIEDFIDEVDIVILSRGMDLVLQTSPETVDLLKMKNKEYHILQTQEAVKLYNKLVGEGKKVGALIHSTC